MEYDLQLLEIQRRFLELRYGWKRNLQISGNYCTIEMRYNDYHGEDGKFISGGGSPSGHNDFEVKRFESKQKLNNHWQNGRTHRQEYAADGITTAEQYEKRAVSLIESPVGGDIRGHMDKAGRIIRYDRAKNDFVKGHPKKGIMTMFKPEEGEKYYDRMREEDLKNGGKA